MKIIPLSQGLVAQVSDEDYDRLIQLNWYALEARHGFRAATHINGENKHTYMHQFILDVSSLQRIDHIDGNGLNNQRENLRLCSNSQNIANSGPRSNNTSGYKGVYFCKCTNKWRAEIKVDGRKKCLGRYTTPEQAAEAYNKGAIQYFGEFGYQNKINYESCQTSSN